MKTIFGTGPIKIKKNDLEASFDYYISGNIDFIFDIKNMGKKNANGDLLDLAQGVWLKMNLVLVDPPAEYGGESADNWIKLLQIFNYYLSADRDNQYFEICPAYGEVQTYYQVKLADPKVSLRDISKFRGKGQSMSLSIIFNTRYSQIPIEYSEEGLGTYSNWVTEAGEEIITEAGDNIVFVN